MPRAARVRLSLGLIALVMLAAVLSGCGSNTTEPVVRLTVNASASLLSATVQIAAEQGFFADEGIEVQVEDYATGRAALAAVLAGELDIAAVAQTPVVLQSFERQDFAILSTMVTSFDEIHVVARADRGLAAPGDLRGRRVGTTLGTSAHFFLALLLAEASLSLADVELVDLAPQELAAAFAAGEVDAIAMWDPHVSNAKAAVGDGAIIFEPGDILRTDFYFVANKQWLSDHDAAVRRYLRALVRAADFIDANPEESKAIIVRRTALPRALVDAQWSKYSFQITLDQSLLNTLELQAHWAIASGFVEAVAIPNYLEFVWSGPLAQVRPAAVRFVN